MYICIARIRETPLTHCQRNANNRQTGGVILKYKFYNTLHVAYLLTYLSKLVHFCLLHIIF